MLNYQEDTSKERFFELLDILYKEKVYPGEMQATAISIAKLLSCVSGVSIEQDLNQSPSIDTTEGIAISPVQAAKCMEEVQRSRRFLLGVQQAIKDKLEHQQKVNLLYVGTGPYGSIVLPVLSQFSSQQLQVTLLDIHQENVDAVKRVVDWLAVGDYIKALIHHDALKWQPEFGETFDIIVSETMNNFLLREPQVPIFIHLQQFLKTDGCLIPEKITIEAGYCPSSSKAQSEFDEYCPIANIIEFDVSLAKQLYQKGTKKWLNQFTFPDISGFLHNFEFRTYIQVYQSFKLEFGDSSLNLPVKHINKSLVKGDIIQCEYNWQNTPKWEIEYPELFATLPLLAAEQVNENGIMSLYRFWDKYRRMPSEFFDQELVSQEATLDIELLQLLGLDYSEVIQYICVELPELNDFENWIKQQSVVPCPEDIRRFNQQVILFNKANLVLT